MGKNTNKGQLPQKLRYLRQASQLYSNQVMRNITLVEAFIKAKQEGQAAAGIPSQEKARQAYQVSQKNLTGMKVCLSAYKTILQHKQPEYSPENILVVAQNHANTRIFIQKAEEVLTGAYRMYPELAGRLDGNVE